MQSERTLSGERNQLKGKRDNLLTLIEADKGGDLHGQIQDEEAACGRLEREAKRVRNLAEASKCLRQTLVAEQDRIKDDLTRPVLNKVRPYLASLFPEAEITLDGDWNLTGRKKGEALVEDYDVLSYGTREQISILTRLGLGEVLAGSDRLPVVLDDALVHTDPDRLDAMLSVLHRAAGDHLQLLVFSCHPQAYDAIGADQVYKLNDLVKR